MDWEAIQSKMEAYQPFSLTELMDWQKDKCVCFAYDPQSDSYVSGTISSIHLEDDDIYVWIETKFEFGKYSRYRVSITDIGKSKLHAKILYRANHINKCVIEIDKLNEQKEIHKKVLISFLEGKDE